MSTAEVHVDDEIYNMVMKWVSLQKFAQRARHFIANIDTNSREWNLWSYSDDEESDDDDFDVDDEGNAVSSSERKQKRKKVSFTPSFGSRWFRYKGRLLNFQRYLSTRQNSLTAKEEIYISSFGRNPRILKTLLDECRSEFNKLDVNHTVIYRGGLKFGVADPVWTRCVSRVSRLFSTVVLDERIKRDLLDDMKDYLHPRTKRWYSNRGIPYRRGDLLHGPPGTGKSSLSFAIAGYFKLDIYIVSLNSPTMDEQKLGTLFSGLPKQCVVLLEDIDIAGLTHGRRSGDMEDAPNPLTAPNTPSSPDDKQAGQPRNTGGGRISLSGLLNVLDGVASQEGRILIMTTNFIDNLDEALIRPGRIDMTIQFSLATTDMMLMIFGGIFATLEGDIPPTSTTKQTDGTPTREQQRGIQASSQASEGEAKRIKDLGEEFARPVQSDIFSPAEIQGYLLKWKRNPEKAVGGAADWVALTLEEKRKKKSREAVAETTVEGKERLRSDVDVAVPAQALGIVSS